MKIMRHVLAPLVIFIFVQFTVSSTFATSLRKEPDKEKSRERLKEIEMQLNSLQEEKNNLAEFLGQEESESIIVKVQREVELKETKSKYKDYFSMSLEELMEIPVITVASKSAEKATDAPASVKVWKANDIERLGYYTIRDLAKITPGFTSQTAWDLESFVVRGLSAGGWDNNRVLLLVDDIPVNLVRNYHARMVEDLPLYFAEQVEFLKGPASAVYGTSAFLGTVSIKSKNLEPGEKLFESKTSIGNFPVGAKRFMGNAIYSTKDFQGKLFSGFFYKDDSDRTYKGEGGSGYYNMYDNLEAVFLNTSFTITNEDSIFNGVTPGIIYMSRRGGLGASFMGFSHRFEDLSYQSFIPYIKYNQQLTDRLSLNAWFKYHQYIERGIYPHEAEDSSTGYGSAGFYYQANLYNLETQFDLRYSFADDLNLLVGWAYDIRQEKNYPDGYAYQFNYSSPYITLNDAFTADKGPYRITSYFAQLKKEFDFLEGLNVTLGGRIDKGATYDEFSPRVGFVQHITNELAVKAIYGSAIKSPGIKEYGFNQEPLHLGAPGNIMPETVDSYELSLVWNKPSFKTELTYFCTKINDPIVRATVLGKDQFTNDPGYNKSEGIEFDMEWLATPDCKLFANGTLPSTEDKNGNELTYLPSWHGSVGIMYDIKPVDLSIASVLKLTGDYKLNDGSSYDGSAIWDVNVIKKVDKNVNLEFQVLNIMDVEYLHPSSWVSAPQPRRSFFVTLSAKF